MGNCFSVNSPKRKRTKINPPVVPEEIDVNSSESQNEATSQLYNLTERGKKLQLEGQAEGDINLVNLAVKILKRGVQTSKSTDVSESERARVCLQFISAIGTRQELQVKEGIENFDVTMFFDDYTIIQFAYKSIRALKTRLKPKRSEFSTQWHSDVEKMYHGVILSALRCIAVAQNSESESLSSRTNKRLSYFKQLCNIEADFESDAITLNIRFHTCEILVNSSVLMEEEKKFANAASLISQAEDHLVCISYHLQNIEIREYIPAQLISFEDFKSQILYQKCSLEAAAKIAVGYKRLEAFTNDDSCEQITLLLAVDAFKEAQVLSREISVPKEAQATAKLAFIFRTVPVLKDKHKSDAYYQHAFSLIESQEYSTMRLTEWGKDVMLQRERIQQELASYADRERNPVLQKYDKMLSDLREKLIISCTDEANVLEAARYLYETYFPGEDTTIWKSKLKKVEEKIAELQIGKAIKLIVRDYHPDRYHRNNVGLETNVLCEEVTKMANQLYSRFFKS